jgi:manganese transport protein
MGEGAVMKLLIFSQVVLSFQLPFAIIPLVKFTSDRAKMGEFANRSWITASAWMVAAAVIALNGLLLVLILR